MLIFTDLETTGLASGKCAVLEVAAIATDDALNEVARIQRVIYYPHAAAIVEALAKRSETYTYNQVGASFNIHPKVVDMHDVNGLWKDCVSGLALDTVDRDLAAFVLAHGTTLESDADPVKGNAGITRVVKPQLAGSTISFDRGFIEAHLPRFESTLHYRNLDVSSFNETAKRFWPELYASRPNNTTKAHRGMDDILESIRVYKHYLAGLAPVTAALASP